MENAESKEIVISQNNSMVSKSETLIDEIQNNSKELYCSLPLNTLEDRKTIFNAMGKCDYRLSDCLNTTINLKHIIAQKYTSTNQDTGEVTDKVRTIFIDSDNKTYASASNGLFSSTKKLLALMGTPDTWKEPIPIQVVETTTKQGFKTFEIKLI